LQDTVSLFPDTQGVGLYTGKVLNIPDAEAVHFYHRAGFTSFLSAALMDQRYNLAGRTRNVGPVSILLPGMADALCSYLYGFFSGQP
jgi:hypothetical protein